MERRGVSPPPGGSTVSISKLEAMARPASMPVLPGLSEKLAALSSGLASRTPQSRQRIFAAHSMDVQQLKQMVGVLTNAANKRRARGNTGGAHITATIG